MEWAPVVIKEIISAFRQQHSLQDSEKLKNIVREVMAENISREQNKLLCEIMVMLNKDSVQSSREVDKTSMERDQLKEECEKLTKEMERLMRQDKKIENKQESTKEPSAKQKTLLQRVNELKKANAGKGRSRSRHRNADGDGKLATNQSQGQQHGQPHSHGAISKFKHQGMKGKANPSFPGNLNDDSRVYPASQHHPFISGQNTYGQPGHSPTMNTFQQYHGTRMGQLQHLHPGVGQQQYQGTGAGQQQHHHGRGGGQQQYPYCNPQGFLQHQQNPQHYKQKSQISQPYNPNSEQQHQPQFGNTETTAQHQQFQYRGQFHRGRQSQQRGKFQQRGQFQHRGQVPHQGGFHHQQRGNFQPKDRSQIMDDESLMSQFTAEELNLLKEILEQKKLQGQEANKDAGPNSQMKPGLKKKRQVKALLNKGEDSIVEPQQVNDSNDDSDFEDDLDEIKKQLQSAYKAQLEAMESKKNMAIQGAQGDSAAEQPTTKNITCTNETKENKKEDAEETSTAFNLCVASGLDISKLQEGPEWDAMLSSMVLVAKRGGQTATCQPKTLSEMGEFKKKYPNAEILVLKEASSLPSSNMKLQS